MSPASALVLTVTQGLMLSHMLSHNATSSTWWHCCSDCSRSEMRRSSFFCQLPCLSSDRRAIFPSHLELPGVCQSAKHTEPLEDPSPFTVNRPPGLWVGGVGWSWRSVLVPGRGQAVHKTGHAKPTMVRKSARLVMESLASCNVASARPARCQISRGLTTSSGRFLDVTAGTGNAD